MQQIELTEEQRIVETFLNTPIYIQGDFTGYYIYEREYGTSSKRFNSLVEAKEYIQSTRPLSCNISAYDLKYDNFDKVTIIGYNPVTKMATCIDTVTGKEYYTDKLDRLIYADVEIAPENSQAYAEFKAHETIVDTGYKAMQEITNRSNLKRVDFNTLNAGGKAQ